MNERPTPETDADNETQFELAAWELLREARRERDEAREKIEQQRKEIVRLNGATSYAGGTLLKIALRERDEARKELSSIHRWIERNHADGFIDSLTYLQNLERVTDSWYDRIDAIESDARRFVKERDEAREEINELIYIAERAIALADIDFENDKFGVVSELRGGLQRIKEETKWVDQHQKQIRVVAMRYPATTGGLREAICTICKRIRAARLFMQRSLAGLSESATRRGRH